MTFSTIAEGAAPLLSVRDLRTYFRTDRGILRAVDGVSFDLMPGETLGVVGESGSGKSVLVRTIMNLLPANAIVPTVEAVRYNGFDVHAMSPARAKHFWGPDMAMVFQDPMTALNPVKKIGVQLTEAMRFHLDLTKKQAMERAVELMGEVGIPEPRRRLGQYPHELSGGMRQRVVIAIAISCEPHLLIADEPTTALDVTVQRQILDLLARLQAQHAMSMILISHDLGVVSGMSDRVAVMYAGKVVEIGPGAQLFSKVRHPYTAALLESIPRVDLPPHTRLQAIAGRPPDMTNPPTGCRFRPRCQNATTDCERGVPRLTPVEGQPMHSFRCFHPVTWELAMNRSSVGTERRDDSTAAVVGVNI